MSFAAIVAVAVTGLRLARIPLASSGAPVALAVFSAIVIAESDSGRPRSWIASWRDVYRRGPDVDEDKSRIEPHGELSGHL